MLNNIKPRAAKEIASVLGVPVGDLRVVTDLLLGIGPLTTETLLSPGETAVILVNDTLLQMGYPQDRIFAILQRYKERIFKFMEGPSGKLGLLSLQEGRYVQWEGEEEVLDLSTMEPISKAPFLAVAVCLSTLGLYLRTFAKPQDPRVAAVTEISASPEAGASPE